MQKKISKILIAAFVFGCFFRIALFATGSGAYRVETPDAGPMGMGSAFVAQADRPSAVYYNPAGLVQLKGQRQVSLGTSVIQPFSKHTSPDGIETSRKWQRFVVPHLYYVDDFGLESFSFGIGASSYWGLGTEWAENSFSQYHATETNMETRDISLAGAYLFNEHFSIGFALDYNQAKVSRRRKIRQVLDSIENDGDMLLKGKDNASWGGRIGLLYKPSQKHSFGLMYRSPIQVKYEGRLYMDNLTNDPALPGDFSYQGVFGGSSYNTRFTSKSTLPQSLVFGYCYKPNKNWAFEANVEWMNWSSIKHELLRYPEETHPHRLAILNSGNPVDKKWNDAISAAFGMEYKASDRLRLRAGYYYHQSPVPDSTFESSLPDSDSHSPTVGFGYDFNQRSTLDFAYSAMFYRKRNVSNDVGSGLGIDLDGSYETFVNIYMLTFTYNN